MVITTSQCLERQSYGQTSLNEKLTQWTLQSVWLWSNSQEQWKLNQILITSWTQSAIGQLPALSPLRTGTIWMLSRSPKGTWCDYCKMRWSTHDWCGQTQAIWQITSKRGGKLVVRHYCHACAQDVQDWSGTIWKLQEQIDYAKGKETLDVQFE